jgi:hypothetical protein
LKVIFSKAYTSISVGVSENINLKTFPIIFGEIEIVLLDSKVWFARSP